MIWAETFNQEILPRAPSFPLFYGFTSGGLSGMQNQSPISQMRWGFVLWALILAAIAKRETTVFLLPLDGGGIGGGDNFPGFQGGKVRRPGNSL
jgi:hypothetical protein